MTATVTGVFIIIILVLVLMELLVIQEQTSNGRQSARLRVPVQIEERLPKRRRFFWHPGPWSGAANTLNSEKEKGQ